MLAELSGGDVGGEMPSERGRREGRKGRKEGKIAKGGKCDSGTGNVMSSLKG